MKYLGMLYKISLASCQKRAELRGCKEKPADSKVSVDRKLALMLGKPWRWGWGVKWWLLGLEPKGAES